MRLKRKKLQRRGATRILSLVSVIALGGTVLLVGAEMAAAAVPCFVSGPNRGCCLPTQTPCNNGDFVWTCTNTTTASYIVTTVVTAPQSANGKVAFISTVQGSCTRTAYLCGGGFGECVFWFTTPLITCSDTILDINSANCTGGSSEG